MIYSILINVSRMNPAIYRLARIDGKMKITDLYRVSEVAFGLEDTDAECELYPDDFFMEGGAKPYIVNSDSGLEEALNQINHGKLFFRKKGKGRLSKALEMNFDVMEQTDGELTVPIIDKAEGGLIPQGKYDPGEINLIVRNTSLNTSFTDDGGRIFQKKELIFEADRCENSLRKIYAPETARKEVNLSLGQPAAHLFHSMNMDILKSLAYQYNVNTYGMKRKDEYVTELSESLDNYFLDRIFDILSPEEYRYFKEMVLNDQLDRLPQEAVKKLPSLSEFGLIWSSNKEGVMLAREVLEFYDGWFDSPEEAALISLKFINGAIKASASLYGVFSKKMFLAVLERFADITIDSLLIDRIYDLIMQRRYISDIGHLRADILYDEGELTKKEADRFWSLQLQDLDCYYIPTREEIADLSANGLRLSKEHEKFFMDLFDDSNYYSYRDYAEEKAERYTLLVRFLHKNADDEAIKKMLRENSRQLRWSYNSDALLNQSISFIKEERKTFPLIILRGFSRANAPDKVLHRAKEAQELEAAQNKQKKAVRAAAVKKRK